MLKPSGSVQSGLAPHFEPKFTLNALTGQVGASAAPATTVGFGIEILRAKLKAFMELKAPEVAANLVQVECEYFLFRVFFFRRYILSPFVRFFFV
jgi:hypothetical protein